MIYLIQPYNGPYRNPNIDSLYSRWPDIIRRAEYAITSKISMAPPTDSASLVFNLIDVEGVPMITPTGQTTPDYRGNGNNLGTVTRIELSAPAVANDFWGLTSAEKVITHEIVHSWFMYYGGMKYAPKPLWMKEGMALWIADQTYNNDFRKVPVEIRNSRWVDYLSYISLFEDALKRGYTPMQLTNVLLA